MIKAILTGLTLLLPLTVVAENKEIINDSTLPDKGMRKQFDDSDASSRPTGSSHATVNRRDPSANPAMGAGLGSGGQLGNSNTATSVPNNGSFGNNNANSGAAMGGSAGDGAAGSAGSASN